MIRARARWGSVVLGGLLAAVLAGGESGAAEPSVTFGIHTPQEDVEFERIVETWRRAEELGFTSAWLYDHFLPIMGDRDEPVLEGWTTLAALARETDRLRIGILVTGNTYRNPALLSKMATTVDHLSGGRLEVGIGAGWFEPEHRAYGFEYGSARDRADWLEESLEILRSSWTEKKTSYDGRKYDAVDATFFPKPVQKPHPPIVVGGQGKNWIMPLVARYADEWNVPLGIEPDGVRERIDIMNAECARIGRDPCVEKVSLLVPLVAITNVPFAGPATRALARFRVEPRIARSILVGSADDIEERLRAYVDAGVDHFIMNLRPPFSEELLERFAREVMPRFQ